MSMQQLSASNLPSIFTPSSNTAVIVGSSTSTFLTIVVIIVTIVLLCYILYQRCVNLFILVKHFYKTFFRLKTKKHERNSVSAPINTSEIGINPILAHMQFSSHFLFL